MLLNPLGICMHSGIMTRIVSFESRVKIPWNSPISRLNSERPVKHPRYVNILVDLSMRVSSRRVASILRPLYRI